MARSKQTRSTPWPRLRRFLSWLIRLRGSPQAIARGVGVGMIVAFTPTIGFQTLMALGIATLLNANRPVSIVPTWLTNPLTIPPVYAFTYYLGSFFWAGPEPAIVARAMRTAARELELLDFLALREQLGVFLDLGLDVFMAMWIGGLIVGSIAAAIAYPLTLRTVVRLRARRVQKLRFSRSWRTRKGMRALRRSDGSSPHIATGTHPEPRAQGRPTPRSDAPDDRERQTLRPRSGSPPTDPDDPGVNR